MTLTEVAVMMLIVGTLSVSLPVSQRDDPFRDDLFRSDVFHTQLLALAYNQKLYLDERWGIDVWFNANGNINEPVKMTFKHQEVVLRLGTGRFDVSRLSDH